MQQKMSVFVSWRKISTLVEIMLCLTDVVMPAMTQSSNVIPPTPICIYKHVFYGNSFFCESPLEVITNLNTSEELIVGNRTESEFYQHITDSTFVDVDNLQQIEACKNGMAFPVSNLSSSHENEDDSTCPDIAIENIIKWPCYPVVGRSTGNISVTLRNNGSLPAEEFDVNCSLNISYLNATGGVEYEETLLPSKRFSLDLNATDVLIFEWDPPGDYTAHLPYYDVSRIKIVADTDERVIEMDETNNEKVSVTSWRIYTETGYGANHPLETFKHNTEPIKCRVAYTTGTSYYLPGDAGAGGDADYGPVYFNNVYPEGATPKLARLYVYWTGGYGMG